MKYVVVQCLVNAEKFRSHVGNTDDGRDCKVPQPQEILFEDFTLAFLEGLKRDLLEVFKCNKIE